MKDGSAHFGLRWQSAAAPPPWAVEVGQLFQNGVALRFPPSKNLRSRSGQSEDSAPFRRCISIS
jgi:hypothetical protein